MRRGSCWPDLPPAHQQHVTTASTHLHPVRAFHRGSRTLEGLQACCLHTTPSSLISLPSISCALIRHLIHLNLGSGLSEPLIPLHFLLAHASSHHRRLHFYQFLQDRQHRGPFQTSSTGPESLQMLEFLYFTYSYVGISSKP